jgi:hypothetical protein
VVGDFIGFLITLEDATNEMKAVKVPTENLSFIHSFIYLVFQRSTKVDIEYLTTLWNLSFYPM